MLQAINIINELTEKEIKIIFIRQPELLTNSSHGKLLMAIYGYFAEAKRKFLSMRTISGLANTRAKGKLLGRPRGAKNSKGSPFDELRNEILKLLKLGFPLNSILKIINNQSELKLSYTGLRCYIEHVTELMKVK